MNVGTFNNNPPENTVLPWLLPCTCGQQRCHCNAIFKPNLLCVKGLPYQSPPPIINKGWKVDPLIIIMADVRATTCTPSMKSTKIIFKIPK